MDLVEQRRHALNLVDDNGRGHARLGERLEAFRVGEELRVHAEVEEVEPGGIRKGVARLTI